MLSNELSQWTVENYDRICEYIESLPYNLAKRCYHVKVHIAEQTAPFGVDVPFDDKDDVEPMEFIQVCYNQVVAEGYELVDIAYKSYGRLGRTDREKFISLVDEFLATNGSNYIGNMKYLVTNKGGDIQERSIGISMGDTRDDVIERVLDMCNNNKETLKIW